MLCSKLTYISIFIAVNGLDEMTPFSPIANTEKGFESIGSEKKHVMHSNRAINVNWYVYE